MKGLAKEEIFEKLGVDLEQFLEKRRNRRNQRLKSHAYDQVYSVRGFVNIPSSKVLVVFWESSPFMHLRKQQCRSLASWWISNSDLHVITDIKYLESTFSPCQTTNLNYPTANFKTHAVSRQRIETEQNADGTAHATRKEA